MSSLAPVQWSGSTIKLNESQCVCGTLCLNRRHVQIVSGFNAYRTYQSPLQIKRYLDLAPTMSIRDALLSGASSEGGYSDDGGDGVIPSAGGVGGGDGDLLSDTTGGSVSGGSGALSHVQCIVLSSEDVPCFPVGEDVEFDFIVTAELIVSYSPQRIHLAVTRMDCRHVGEGELSDDGVRSGEPCEGGEGGGRGNRVSRSVQAPGGLRRLGTRIPGHGAGGGGRYRSHVRGGGGGTYTVERTHFEANKNSLWCFEEVSGRWVLRGVSVWVPSRLWDRVFSA